MARPLFSILHSSARPQKWREIYDAWIKAAVNPEQVEYVLCCDTRWGFQLPDPRLDNWVPERAGLNRLEFNGERRCYVDGVNTAAKASTGRILIVNADDQYPCDKWDQDLEYLQDNGACVCEVSTGTPDEHDRGIMVMPILSRARYERLGYVFYPEYESMFADADFCEHARQDGVVIDARHLLFPHRHPLFDQSARIPGIPWNHTDPQYAAQNRREAFELGYNILKRRRATKFSSLSSPSTHQQDQSLNAQGVQSDWLDAANAIQGWMTREELQWLYDTASQVQSVTEIGCWKGRSTYALASGCKGTVYAVDHFKGSNEPEHIAEVARLGGSTFEDFRKNVGHFENITAVPFESSDAVKLVPDTDFVFIDGSHDYESVKADLLAWKDKAKKWIAGHDAAYPDVARAVSEILGNVQRGPHGIWLKVKGEQGRIVVCILGETFSRAWVRNIFVTAMHLKQRGFLVATVDEYASTPAVARQRVLDKLQALSLNPDDLVLWLDDDNMLPVLGLDTLLEDLAERPDIDGVAGWCWIQDEGANTFQCSVGEWTADKLHWISFNPRTFPKEQKPRTFECGGFPCVLMRYRAIEKAGRWPFRPILDDRMTEGMAGEDMSFWYNASNGGAKFLVDPRVQLPHYKKVAVAPQFPEENAPVNVVACMMRVKNEARWIEKSLGSVKALCGEHIYVMEDGSTDGTPEMIQASGAKLVHSPFAGEALDERRDKNWLMHYVIDQCSPDWILHIDGDEVLEPDGCQKIYEFLKGNPKSDVLGLRVVNLWDGFDQVRVDGVYGGMVRQSLFRPRPEFEFKSYYEGEPGHNHVGLHTSNAPYSMECQPVNVFLLHFGYVYREDRLRKYRWITQLDPDNKIEDFYRHTVLGDLPEFPKDMRTKHGGPLELRKIPARLITRFAKDPGPVEISGSAQVVEATA